VFIFCLLDSFWAVPRASIPFSCFARSDSFSAVPRASGPFFMFCARGLVFGNAEGVGSHFHVFRSRARFWRYRGRRFPFSCFALPGSFSALPRASGPIFMFCAPVLVFGGSECLGSRFHVLCARTRFRRNRGCQIPFSCFMRPHLFSTEPRALCPVFMFCAPGCVLGGSKGVGSPFHVLHSRTHFRRYRGRRVPFSYFACPNSFSTAPGASGPVFMFCAPALIIGGTEGVSSRFNVLRSPTRFRR
jgi:hypothetical protein